jgi:FKBP-type peptidyl-prolyl cis-trans isomerase FkpA
MKRCLIAIFLTSAALSGCVGYTGDELAPINNTSGTTNQNGGSTSQATLDDVKLQSYFKTNSITTTADLGGLYYQITKAGSGAFPTAASVITVNYTVKLLDGTPVDSGLSFTATLNTLISGWILGIPHINGGGSIVLYIPSQLAYGTAAIGNIPPNSILIATVDLISFR